MAQAATDLVNLEKEKDKIKQLEKSTGVKYQDKVKEMSAILERKIGAMEALIAVRRNSIAQVLKSEEIT